MTESERIEYLITHLAHGNANRFADRTGMSKANGSMMYGTMNTRKDGVTATSNGRENPMTETRR
jgi:hypothetical protein